MAEAACRARERATGRSRRMESNAFPPGGLVRRSGAVFRLTLDEQAFGVVHSRQSVADRCGVEGAGHAQRPGKGAAPLGQVQARGIAVQMRPASGQSPVLIRNERAVASHDPEQVGRGRSRPAAHAGADRVRHRSAGALGGHGALG
jgi:hypothetical protein